MRHCYRKDFRKYDTSDLGTTMFVGVILILLVAILFFYPPETFKEWLGVGAMIVVLLLSILSWVYSFNQFPDIAVDQNGIAVEFLWKYIQLSWADIMVVQMVSQNFVPEESTIWFVKTTRLTPFHRIYGRAVIQHWETGFLIHSNISDRKLLWEEFEKRGFGTGKSTEME